MEVPLVDPILVDGLGTPLQLSRQSDQERRSREVCRSEKPNQGSPSEASEKNAGKLHRLFSVRILILAELMILFSENILPKVLGQ